MSLEGGKDGSPLLSRVSSARSAISSMFAGSEDDNTETDAYTRAKKVNQMGQVSRRRPTQFM